MKNFFPLNIIIGRNNSGKSSLLDLIQYAATEDNSLIVNHLGAPSQIFFRLNLTREFLCQHVNPSLPVKFGNMNAVEFMIQNHENQSVNLAIGPTGVGDFFGNNRLDSLNVDAIRETMAVIRKSVGNPLRAGCFRRINAERDVIPESDSAPNTQLEGSALLPNGNGATKTISRILLGENFPNSLIDHGLLNDLNEIFAPDLAFSRLTVKQKKGGQYEVNLEEKAKGWIPISRMGSGIKTVLLIFLELHVSPQLIYKRPLSECIFAFEEPENNLHPSVQRRLFAYIRDKTVRDGCMICITTHSHVVIDQFSYDKKTQIIHTKSSVTSMVAKAVSAYLLHCNILDDLDIRASDLLQSNAIIWVEGSSDRLYVNKWIELWTDGALREGVDYQCLSYGGSLLAAMSFEQPGEVDRFC